jgi:hypothetical protein
MPITAPPSAAQALNISVEQTKEPNGPPAAAVTISLPRRRRGRQTSAEIQAYRTALKAFAGAILQIRSGLDFEVSARGWCYVLEAHSLAKGDFDSAEGLINDCRKKGLLPLDICAQDEGRNADGLEYIDETSPEEEADDIIASALSGYRYYRPISFWDDLPVYVEMVVEKIDLKSLFTPICEEFAVPIANASGWNDLNSRAAMMRRFARWERAGKQCVLLYCGDFDPGGFLISQTIRSNLADLGFAVGWRPYSLKINRFGLNYEFIQQQGLTWIDNLHTGSGKFELSDPRHPDHRNSYVQDYLHQYCEQRPDGTWKGRKVEANALVVRPEAGRELCRQAILRYVPEDAPSRYAARLESEQSKVRRLVAARLTGAAP